MSLVVNTNVGSLNAQRSLTASASELKTAMERLSSGKKINSAADDAAGFAIAERMTAQIRGLNMATKNVNDGLSMIAVIENATNDVTDMLHRMRELAVQATNDTNGNEDRQFLQKEVSELVSEIDRIATQTKYNGLAVLDGSFHNKRIQVGTEAGQNVHFSVSGIKAEHIGDHGSSQAVATATAIGDNGTHVTVTLDDASEIQSGDLIGIGEGDNTYWGWSEVTDVTGSTITISLEAGTEHAGYFGDNFTNGNTSITKVTQPASMIRDINVENSVNAGKALATISAAIEQVAGDRASYGALQNRLEYTVSNLMNVAEYTTAARSRIEDADFAAESARLAKAQVLQQTGTAMLAQANASPQLALSLIR